MDDPRETPIRIEVTPQVRGLVAALLRVGLGLGLLNIGLLGRMAAMTGTGMPGPRLWQRGFPMAPAPAPAPGAMNYIYAVSSGEIAIGLALTLGYFTLAAAFAAGMLILVTPLFQTIVLLGSGVAVGGAPWGGLAYFELISSGATSNLLACAAVMWLSRPGSNPWSLDALMFARAPAESAVGADPALEAEPVPPREPGPPAPPPGQRTAAFIASRRIVEPDEGAAEPAGPEPDRVGN